MPEGARILLVSDCPVERQRLEGLLHLLDALPLPACALHADGTLAIRNGAFVEYAGDGGTARAADAHRALVHPEDRDAVEREWESSLKHGLPFEAEYRLLRADGEYRWHLGRALPQRDPSGPDGRLLGWIATLTDVHELRRAREAAQVASRAKDEFLAAVSHELRSPLNVILGWVRLLRAGRLDEVKRSRALATVERNTEVQLALVEDLLDVSRIITGRLRIVLKAVSLLQVIDAALETVRPAAAQKEIQLETVLDPSADRCAGDPDRLLQVVWNLLSNAIKFTPLGGRVELRLEREESFVQLRVSDTGCGIAAEFLPHVFEPFRQAEPIHTRTHGGLGLGLAITRHIVESHGGTVSADSPGEGKGATFLVQLPMRSLSWVPAEAPLTAPERRVTPAESELPTLAGLRVLVVDDETDARELTALILGEAGASVVAVANATLALRELQRRPFDVLVSDVGMPHEDGCSLIRKVRALEGDAGRIPAAAITGFARAEDGSRALQAGFQVHVPKPIEPALLVLIVARLAGRVGARGYATGG
jgi:signal transduction histidine kinase